MGWLFKMVADFAVHLYQEHPKLVVFILMMCGLTFYGGTYTFVHKTALAGELDDMQTAWQVEINTMKAQFTNQIDAVQTQMEAIDTRLEQANSTTQRQFLLIQINSMEREIYELEELVESGRANASNRDRLVNVRHQLDEQLRQLNAIPTN